jgi:hypothetical protein
VSKPVGPGTGAALARRHGEVFHLAHQPRTAWSFLSEVRPFREAW